MALSGEKILGVPIIVQPSEADKNRAAAEARSLASGGKDTDSNSHRLYIGGIHPSLSEEDVKEVFLPFGPIEYFNIGKGKESATAGYAFLQCVYACVYAFLSYSKRLFPNPMNLVGTARPTTPRWPWSP